MSLQTRLSALITAIGADVKNLTNTMPSQPAQFSMDGICYAKNGTLRFPVLGGTYTISAVTATVGTSPAGAALVVDVRKNGTTIYTGGVNRPSIAAGSNSANGGAPSTSSVTTGDYLTVDVVSVGSTTPGSDLVVNILLTRTS